MALVYIEKLNKKLNNIEGKITGIYGDIIDLESLGIELTGISYDDEWTVKRFLNGLSIFKNKNINKILEYLEIDKSILNHKLVDLSFTKLNFILLIYLILNKKSIIVFDHFDVTLSHKDKRTLTKIIKLLNKDNTTIIIISNDLVYLSSIVDKLMVINNGSIIYDDKFNNYLDYVDSNVPEILEFINEANKLGANLNKTLDSRELLKDIYRSKN
jgi:ABC-type multidrug transport system ATPase subunit